MRFEERLAFRFIFRSAIALALLVGIAVQGAFYHFGATPIFFAL